MKLKDAFRDVYALMDAARNRPAMHGIGGQSYRLLKSFLGGLSYSDLDAGDPPFWDFTLWAHALVDGRSSSRPTHWLEQQFDDEAGYHEWYRLLDGVPKDPCRGTRPRPWLPRPI